MELTLFGDTVFRADSLTYFLLLYIYTLFVTGKRKPYVYERQQTKMWKKSMLNSDFLTNTLEVPVSGDM